MKIPVVCVHNGKHRYLYYVIRQAKLYCEDVILLGENVSTSCKKIAKYYSSQQFSESNMLKQFAALYQHLSTNNLEFEKACFSRWFQILEFMRQNKMESIIHIDSDNLIYKNMMSVIERKIPLYDAGYNIAAQNYDDMIWAASPHISFWKYDKLQDFCLFILDQYKNGMDELIKKWDLVKAGNLQGGISDMTLLYLFYLKNHDAIANLLLPVDKRYYIDQNINIAQNYFEDEFRIREIKNGISLKDVRMTKELPLCFNEREKKEIEFVSLHFQGFAKNFIYLFVNWKPGYPEIIWNKIHLKVNLYKRRIKRFIHN